MGGSNFVSDMVWDLYRLRRTQGWGVEPIRCTTNLISSQALTFNLFGPLAVDPLWGARILSATLGYQVVRVHDVFLEWTPSRPSEYLGDKTVVDALIVFTSVFGREVLCVETKYTDSHTTRALPYGRMATHRSLMDRSSKWSSVPALRDGNQLLRVHLLGERYAELHHLLRGASSPRLLFVHHDLDTKADQMVARYGMHLNAGSAQASVIATPLSRLIRNMRAVASSDAQCAIVSKLERRYVDISLSEDAWHLWQKGSGSVGTSAL